MLPFVEKSLGQRAGALARCAAAFALAAAPVPGPAADADAGVGAPPEARTPAEEREAAKAEAEAEAKALAGEVLSRTDAEEDAEYRDWARRAIERAMTRAGAAAAEAPASHGAASKGAAEPLAAERRAGSLAAGFAGGREAPRVLVFMSLSVPKPSWRQWAAEAARAGVPLVLRGPSPAGLRATVAEVGDRLDGREAGVAIDPRLFRLFGVERAPAVVAAPDGAPACASRGCAEDAPPPFDIVVGNIGLAAALAAIAGEGEAGRAVAREYLAKLGDRP